jgi:hypothetical protein
MPLKNYDVLNLAYSFSKMSEVVEVYKGACKKNRSIGRSKEKIKLCKMMGANDCIERNLSTYI